MHVKVKSKIAWLIFGMVFMLLSACQPIQVETGSPSSGSVTTMATPEAEVEAEVEAAESNEGDAAMISLSGVEQAIATRAVDELATELGITANNITITAMESVEWPDASLGCPEEGMMYAAVLTSGYKIMLDADGQQYEYHSSNREDSNVVKCDPKASS